MYTITRGPSKIATQRRTGPTAAPQLESKFGEVKCRRRPPTTPPQPPGPPWPLASSAPKLVFNRVNGKRPPLIALQTPPAEESYTSAHEENVRFVYEAWQQIEQQLYDSSPGENGPGLVQYKEKMPSTESKDFVPIDLEEWWVQQFWAKIESGS